MDKERVVGLLNNVIGGLAGLREFRDEIFEEIKEELYPKTKPKPLKLEAGCRVEFWYASGRKMTGTVLSVSDKMVWVDEDNTSPDTWNTCRLTVTEAATPEVGDYVQLCGGDVGVITATTGMWYRVFVPGKPMVGSQKRKDFTILYKVPKERE